MTTGDVRYLLICVDCGRPHVSEATCRQRPTEVRGRVEIVCREGCEPQPPRRLESMRRDEVDIVESALRRVLVEAVDGHPLPPSLVAELQSLHAGMTLVTAAMRAEARASPG